MRKTPLLTMEDTHSVLLVPTRSLALYRQQIQSLAKYSDSVGGMLVAPSTEAGTIGAEAGTIGAEAGTIGAEPGY
jgi:hypothetical protein